MDLCSPSRVAVGLLINALPVQSVCLGHCFIKRERETFLYLSRDKASQVSLLGKVLAELFFPPADDWTRSRTNIKPPRLPADGLRGSGKQNIVSWWRSRTGASGRRKNGRRFSHLRSDYSQRISLRPEVPPLDRRSTRRRRCPGQPDRPQDSQGPPAPPPHRACLCSLPDPVLEPGWSGSGWDWAALLERQTPEPGETPPAFCLGGCLLESWWFSASE